MASGAHLFQEGNPGRPAGFPNRLSALQNQLKDLGFNWVNECVARYRDPATPNASRDYCLGLIADRVAPKLKAVEITGAGGGNLSSVLINVIAGGLGQPQPDIIEHAPSVPLAIDQPLDPVQEAPDDLGNESQDTPECG
jgi:hypothetical protein